ncbi:MAG: alpha/beta hydrolase [Sphingobium sp.]
MGGHSTHEAYLQQLDPELRPAVEGFIAFYEGGYDLSTPDKVIEMRAKRSARRQQTNASFAGPSVAIEDRFIPGYEGAPDVAARIYRPHNFSGPAPAMLWLHGGGYVMGDLDGEDLVCARMAHSTGAVVVSVDYRLAPEHPYPAPLHDCYAAYTWLLAESEALGVNRDWVILGGTSAGGGIAAGLCLFLRDRGELMPRLQVLAAPGIDDLTSERLNDARADAPPVGRNLLFNSWHWYLGGDADRSIVPAYASAARANNLSGMPPTYISVGSLDPMLDEDFNYARRLIDHGVKVELHVYPGGCHGFESFAPMAALSQRCLNEREDVVRRLFASLGWRQPQN